MASRKQSPKFQLQFEPTRITELSDRYSFTDDAEAQAAGKRIAGGNFGRAVLETIFVWKTRGRGISRLRRNSDEEIADALRLSVNASTERAAVAVLLGLQGIQVPVASAILTAIDPARYTIIDTRALEALGSNSADRTVNFYLAYLDICRELATLYGVNLRKLDRALWQWSREQPPSVST